MLANRGMFFLHREWALPLELRKRLFTCVLLGLDAAWIQDFELLVLGLHVDCEVDEAMHTNITGADVVDLGGARDVALLLCIDAAGNWSLTIFFERLNRCEF
jgi:hypothetical protein